MKPFPGGVDESGSAGISLIQTDDDDFCLSVKRSTPFTSCARFLFFFFFFFWRGDSFQLKKNWTKALVVGVGGCWSIVQTDAGTVGTGDLKELFLSNWRIFIPSWFPVDIVTS